MNSGIRTEQENTDAQGSDTSKHMEQNGGNAVDINVDNLPNGITIQDVAAMAEELGFTGIIVYTPENGTAKKGPRLHLDRRDQYGFPRYMVEKIKKDGKTTARWVGSFLRDYKEKLQSEVHPDNGFHAKDTIDDD